MPKPVGAAPLSLPGLARMIQRIAEDFATTLRQWDHLTPDNGTLFQLEGRNHVLSEAHRGGYLRIKHDSACSLLIPTEDVHKFGTPECVGGIQAGEGALTIEAQSGVTLNGPGGAASSFTLTDQNLPFALTYIGGNEWDLSGPI